MNVSLEGKSYPEVRFVVEAERVEAFRAAVGAPTGGVPPTFVTAVEFASFPSIVTDPELALDFSRVVHGEQEYVWHRALRAGETVIARPRIAQARAKGGHGFLTIETEIVDEGGEPVALARASMVERADA